MHDTSERAGARLVAREALQSFLSGSIADATPTSGYTLGAMAIGEAVEITLHKGQATFVVWLRPLRHETAAYRRTARFKIGHHPDPPDQLGYALIDALCARIAAWESSLSEEACALLFDGPDAAAIGGGGPTTAALLGLEWLAVRSGIKPACRKVVDADEVGDLVAAAAGDGLHVRIMHAPEFVGGFCGNDPACGAAATRSLSTLLYLARTEAEAATAADAERAMIDACRRGEQVTAEQVRILGGALGYPPCCIDAFIPVRDHSNSEIRFAALRRTAGQALAVLNDAVGGRALLSHAPCRYDCPRAERYARAVLGAFAGIDPTAAAALERSLGGMMVLFRTGGALRLVTAPPPATGAVRFEAIETFGDGEHLMHWRAVLSDADRFDVLADGLRLLRGDEEIGRINAIPDAVQIRLFV